MHTWWYNTLTAREYAMNHHTVPTVCADANSSIPTKLADRGSFQAVALVMDAASFLTEVARSLGRST